MRKATLTILCIFAAGILLAPVTFGQTRDTGTIAGYVIDSGKEPLPGATVTATSPTMPRSRVVVTDASGMYKFQALQPGRYTVIIELDQFNKKTYEALELNIGGALRLDVVMTAKTLNEKEIVVTAAAPLVETEKTAVDTVITNDILTSLPIIGRDFMQSIKILPAVVESAYGTSIAGGRSTDKNYNIDGADNVDIVQGQMYSGGGYGLSTDRSFISLDQEAIQELSVGRGGFSSDVGFGSGGLINVVTKSGSNKFHGSMYVQARDNKWDYRVPYAYQNYYAGGSLGGPIVKDKIMFFLSLSPYYSSTGFDTRSSIYSNVPADLMQKGKGISSFAKLTYLLSANNQLNVTANIPLSRSGSYCTLWHIAPDFPAITYENTGYMFSATDTAMFGKNAVLESVVTYGRTSDKTINPPGVHPGLIINFDGFTATGTYGADANFVRSKFNASERFNLFVDNWLGKHSFRAGAEVRYNHSFDQRGAEESIYYYWSWYPIASSATQTDPVALKLQQTYLATYFGDSWQPAKRLTVNIGIRGSRNSYRPLVLIEPRVGLAYDITGDAKTLIRGNFNIYYDRMNAYVQQMDNYPLSTYIDTYRDGTVYDSREPYRQTVIDPNIKYPHTTEVTIGIDREIVNALAVSADFIYRKYRDQLFTRYINLVDPLTGLRDDPTKGALTLYSNFGHCDYKGLSLVIRKRFSHGYQFLVSYTYQVSRGNSSLFTDFSQLQGIFGSYYLQKGDIQMADMYGRTAYDKPYDFKAFGSVMLPLGFMISGVFNLTAGTPYTTFNSDTRELVSGYQALRSPDLMNLDLRLEKDFRIHKTMVKLQAEAFNLTNRKNVYEVTADVVDPAFNTPWTLGESRRIQFAARFEW